MDGTKACVWAIVVASVASFGCRSDSDEPLACDVGRVLVTTSDFTTGETALFNVATGEVALGTSPNADQDTVAAKAGCTPLLLERGRARLRVQSTANPVVTERTIDVGLPENPAPYAANPSAIVDLGDDRWLVTRLATNTALVVDPNAADSSVRVGTVDFTPLAVTGDIDSVDATDGIRVGDRVFVALGRYYFDSMFAQQFPGTAALAEIDPATLDLVDADPTTMGTQGIALQFQNPWRGLVHDAPRMRLLVGATGRFGELDGAIEIVDLDTNRSAGALVTEATLGAELEGFAVVGATEGVVLAGGMVRRFDLITGALGASFAVPDVRAMSVVGDKLVVAAGTPSATTVRVFRIVDASEVVLSSPPSLGAYPIYSMAAVP